MAMYGRDGDLLARWVDDMKHTQFGASIIEVSSLLE